MNKLLEAKKIANSITTDDSRSTVLNKVVKTYNAVMQACDKKSEKATVYHGNSSVLPTCLNTF